MRNCESRAGTCLMATMIFINLSHGMNTDEPDENQGSYPCSSVFIRGWKGVPYSEYRLKIRQPLVPPKPKLFEKRVVDFHGPGVVGNVIQVAIRIGVLVVDGGWRH